MKMNGFEKRSQKKKEQILKAAFRLLNTEKGIKGVTTQDIVEASGVSKATIFKYFGTKEKLLQQVFIDFLDRLSVESLAFMTEPISFEEKMMAMSQVKINSMEGVHQQFFIDLMDFFTQKDDPILAKKMAAYTQMAYDAMLDLFHQGRKEGKINLKYSDEFLMVYIEAMIQGLSTPAIYKQIVDIPHYTENWTELLLKSLR